MEIAKEHEREAERLKLLDSYSILDSLPEEDYDNLTKLAAEICHTPISLITLLDDKRQWFKSNHGLDLRETSKEQAFCAHAINGYDSVFMVDDAREDIRFHDNPLVTTDPHVIFYAGIPLKNELGLPLGTLCVIDHKPNHLSENQIAALQILSQQVMNLLELRKSKATLEKTNRQLKEFSKDLEKKVTLRTMQLKQKNKELKKMNAELQSFAYISSHDLQEPLRKIQTFSSQILETEKSLSDKGRYRFKRMQLAANRMQHLIQDLLAYSRAEKSEHTFETTSFEHLAEEMRDNLKEELQNKNAILQISGNCTIDLIPALMRQVLSNLIVNSLKFSKKGEQALITINVTTVTHLDIAEIPLMENKRYAQIAVTDNGIGFEQKHAAQIFKIFQRLHSRDKYEGTGIGLAIVKKIVQIHNGHIRVESKPDEGVRFEIFVPIEQAS
jgi:signal transduction histidine kinase